jgi:hypothetical protein
LLLAGLERARLEVRLPITEQVDVGARERIDRLLRPCGVQGFLARHIDHRKRTSQVVRIHCIPQ